MRDFILYNIKLKKTVQSLHGYITHTETLETLSEPSEQKADEELMSPLLY